MAASLSQPDIWPSRLAMQQHQHLCICPNSATNCVLAVMNKQVDKNFTGGRQVSNESWHLAHRRDMPHTKKKTSCIERQGGYLQGGGPNMDSLWPGWLKMPSIGGSH
eukprot:1159570-Pelagomonas_calceolata.AAC.5